MKMNDLPNEIISTDVVRSIQQPEYSNWALIIGSLYVHPLEGEVPCWFYRKMQELILGIRWKKRDD